MSPDTFLIVAVLIAGFAVLAFLVRKGVRKGPAEKEALTEWLKSMQETVAATNKAVNQSLRETNSEVGRALRESSKTLNKRLDNAARYMSQVAKEVGTMSEIGRGMKELQEFLKSPKLRGTIGEEVLADLISQMFPKNVFHLQYAFRSGEKVDAAIQTEAGILPIDSKFPMENFRKMVGANEEKEKSIFRKAFVNDVRKHVRDIAGKYILPEEGTMDFALMYIPSEPVYYEVVNEPELTDYARGLRVYPVSPTTMYAHLQMILLSFEGKKIEARSRQVFRLLRAVQKDYGKVEESLQVLGKHVGNAYAKMGEVNQGYSLLGQKIGQTQVLSEKIEGEESLLGQGEGKEKVEG